MKVVTSVGWFLVFSRTIKSRFKGFKKNVKPFNSKSREYFQNLIPISFGARPTIANSMGLTFIRSFGFKFKLRLILKYFRRWCKNIYLFYCSGFLCSWNVPTTFPKGSHGVHMVLKRIPNGFPKFPKCSSTCSQYQ